MWAWCVLLLAADGTTPAGGSAPTVEQLRFFETSVRPVLVEHCLKCHGPDKQWAGFRLDHREGLLKGGEGGAAVVPGKPEESRLITAIRQTDPDFRMPPEGKLTDRQIADLVRWIEMGAPFPVTKTPGQKRHRDPDHWAFSPAAPQTVPVVQRGDWPQNELDAFLLARLEQAGIAPAADADRPTLIRRLTFDLLGLPPTPEEIAAYVTDEAPDALARLTDRLLASPHYGIRWGRHWLDVARYADSNGLDENVAHGNAWRYRDYVVAAFNRDEPYDRFLQSQLAGDLLTAHDEAERREQLVAVGFLSLGPKVLAEVDELKMQMDIVDEQIETVGKAFLGLTLACARCHDHKFDPVDTADYYGLAGIFKSTRAMEHYKKVARWHENTLPSDETRALEAAHQRQLAARQQAVEQLVQAAQNALKEKSPEQKLPDNPEALFPEETQQKLKELRGHVEALKKTPPVLPAAMGVVEDRVADVAIHIRGNPQKLGDVVARHVPPVLRGPAVPHFTTTHSGRRELADWLTDPRHPLTSRVFVNRVWRWHFGRGIVSTTDNFGLLGEKPSHPELLDWLSRRFSSDGWSLKSLHRLMTGSRAWRQGSQPTPEQMQADPENRLYGRFSIRRLEAEEVRDALLAVGNGLDESLGGSLLNVKNRDYFFDHTSIDKTDYSSRRRAIYLPVVRNHVYDVFQLLDFPDPALTSGDRIATTVAPQALLMLNSDFVLQAAADFAARITAGTGDDRQCLEHACQLAYGRDPTADELMAHLELLRNAEQALPETGTQTRRQQAWAVLCQVVLAANEMIHVR